MGRLKGLNQTLHSLNKEVSKIEKRTLKGLIQAGIVIMRDMEKTSPKIPVDTGNLRASRFLVTSEGTEAGNFTGSFKGKDAGEMQAHHAAFVNSVSSSISIMKKPVIILGFSANYAAKVHESVGTNFQRPGSGAKFLEASLKRNEKEVLQEIQKEARIR